MSTIDAVADEGLRCSQCGYNLTGAVSPRCSECGWEIDWARVRAEAGLGPPQILFEKVRWYWKPLAWIATAATVIATPWIFARQAVRRVSVWHAAAFGGVCAAGPAVWEGVGGRWLLGSIAWAWLAAAVTQVVVQALLLNLLDPHGWRGWRSWRASMRFWLCVGGYTSAIMVTEIIGGPPLLALTDLWEFCIDCLNEGLAEAWRSLHNGFVTPQWWSWLQLGSWLAALGCCLYQRQRAAYASRVRAVALAVAAGALMLWLYSASVEVVGVWVAGFLDSY